jgi:hypothetical protein
MDIGGFEDLRGLRKRDPVRGRRHRAQSPPESLVRDEAAEPDPDDVDDLPLDDEAASLDAAAESTESPDFAGVDEASPSLPVDFFELAGAGRRSFLAQPDPLNTIDGAVIALRSLPSAPHAGQNCGPGSLIPWRISVRWPQARQRYS